jgi:asparagine synthase (glutamine-hydrolysing)
MCGIVGSFHPEGRTCEADVIARMRDRKAHRGPDGCGLWGSRDRRCRLGHRRLSIIDLSDAAAQPMANRDQTVVITFNGEIYNHGDLRRELQLVREPRYAR